MNVRWLLRATNSLRTIVSTIAQDNPAAARDFRLRAEHAALLLGKFPHLGRKGRIDTTREFILIPSYILVYRLHENTVEILEIYHTARKWPEKIN